MAVPALDQPLIRVPAEQMSIACRAQHKRTEKELAAILDDVQQLGAAAAARSLHDDDARARIGALVGQLHGLKRKLEQGHAEQEVHLQRCKARLSSLAALAHAGRAHAGHASAHPLGSAGAFGACDAPCGGNGGAGAEVDMAPAHVDVDGEPARRAAGVEHAERTTRLLADYLHQVGLSETANALGAASGVDADVDGAMYAQAGAIVAALRRRECAPALAWAAEHRARLRRHHSDFEFLLRLQEFVELVRASERGRAIAYARAHFPAHSAAHMALIQRAMATTAFASAPVASAAYAPLFAESAWAALEARFVREHRLLNCAPERPPLLLALSAGLAALRNATCVEGGGGGDDHADADEEPDGAGLDAGVRRRRERASRCPACSRHLRPLAARLPCAHHTRSALLCELTGARMDEANPPYALPNGRVVSAAALGGLGDSLPSPSSLVLDARTGERFARANVRKVFIV